MQMIYPYSCFYYFLHCCLQVGPFVKYLISVFLGYDDVHGDEVENVVLFFDENNTGDLNFAEFLSCIRYLLKARLNPIKWNAPRSELQSSTNMVKTRDKLSTYISLFLLITLYYSIHVHAGSHYQTGIRQSRWPSECPRKRQVCSAKRQPNANEFEEVVKVFKKESIKSSVRTCARRCGGRLRHQLISDWEFPFYFDHFIRNSPGVYSSILPVPLLKLRLFLSPFFIIQLISIITPWN